MRVTASSRKSNSIYVFKVMLKYRRGLWRRIEVKGAHNLGYFDMAIREAFDHDTFDHLSEFYPGSARHSRGFGEIEPGGRGPGAGIRIDSLGLEEGDRLEYVYDFGDYVQHVITLEKIKKEQEESGKDRYPRIVERSVTRRRYCANCEKAGRRTVAGWVCLYCSNRLAVRSMVYLCENCADKHGDHEMEELVY